MKSFPSAKTRSTMSPAAKDLCEEIIQVPIMQSTQTIFGNKDRSPKRVAYNIPISTTSSCSNRSNSPLKHNSIQPSRKVQHKLAQMSTDGEVQGQTPKTKTIRNGKLQQPVIKQEIPFTARKGRSIAVNTTISGPIRRNISFLPNLPAPKIKAFQVDTNVQTLSKTHFTLDKASALSLDSKSCGTQIFYFGKETRIWQTKSQGTLCCDLYNVAKAVLSYSDKCTLIRPVETLGPGNKAQNLSKPVRWAVSQHPVRGPDF